MIKVSIIVPVYNVEQYIDKCLNSLVNQTLKEIEIIVVNDGTKDNSQIIIDKYKNKYSIIKSFIKENGGLSDARNYGMTKARGKYIAFVDSDDYIDITMYEKLYKKAISKNFDITICDCYSSLNNKLTFIDSNIKNDLLNKQQIKQCFINIYPTAWNKLYKKELLNNISFKKGVWYEDVEFLYRLLPRVKTVGVVKEPLYYYLQRDGAITSQVNEKIYHYIDNWNGILDYYKTNNLLNEYYNELEYSYVRYIYATFMKRVLSFDYENYKKALNTAIDNVNHNFKHYRHNKLFYKSFKGIYLLLFNKTLALLIYKIKK
ncbi:MAG: glycosyltransferase [Bacilli bacterium]